MWILIPAFTTQQGTVSKYFIKRELRDWQTVDSFVGLKWCSRPSEFYSEYYQCSPPNLSEILILFSVRQGLKLVQGEWNILKMGNPKYIGVHGRIAQQLAAMALQQEQEHVISIKQVV